MVVGEPQIAIEPWENFRRYGPLPSFGIVFFPGISSLQPERPWVLRIFGVFPLSHAAIMNLPRISLRQDFGRPETQSD